VDQRQVARSRKAIDLVSVFEGVAQHARGQIDAAELQELEERVARLAVLVLACLLLTL